VYAAVKEILFDYDHGIYSGREDCAEEIVDKVFSMTQQVVEAKPKSKDYEIVVHENCD
jgi:hypothetical protein